MINAYFRSTYISTKHKQHFHTDYLIHTLHKLRVCLRTVGINYDRKLQMFSNRLVDKQRPSVVDLQIISLNKIQTWCFGDFPFEFRPRGKPAVRGLPFLSWEACFSGNQCLVFVLNV